MSMNNITDNEVKVLQHVLQCFHCFDTSLVAIQVVTTTSEVECANPVCTNHAKTQSNSKL